MEQVREKMNAREEGTELLAVAGEEERRSPALGEAGAPAAAGTSADGPESEAQLEDALLEVFRLIHRVNNHLQVITINAEMLEMVTGSSNRYVEKILEGAGLIRDMMDTFRDSHADQRQRLLGLRRQIRADLALG